MRNRRLLFRRCLLSDGGANFFSGEMGSRLSDLLFSCFSLSVLVVRMASLLSRFSEDDQRPRNRLLLLTLSDEARLIFGFCFFGESDVLLELSLTSTFALSEGPIWDFSRKGMTPPSLCHRPRATLTSSPSILSLGGEEEVEEGLEEDAEMTMMSPSDEPPRDRESRESPLLVRLLDIFTLTSSQLLDPHDILSPSATGMSEELLVVSSELVRLLSFRALRSWRRLSFSRARSSLARSISSRSCDEVP